MNTVVFIIETPLLQRDVKRFEVDGLRKQGFSPCFFELSSILQPYASKTVIEGRCDYNKENVIVINSWNMLKQQFQKYSSAEFIVKLGNGPYTYRLYKLFKENKLQYALLLPEIVPASSVGQNRAHIKNYITKIRKNPVKSLWGSIYKRIINYLNIQPASVVFYSGSNKRELSNVLSNYCISKETKFKSLASVALLECKKTEDEAICNDNVIAPEKYILFIDQGLPVHPDIISSGISIDSKDYYTQLNWFLSELSHFYSLPIVVALHPRVDYNDNPFNKHFKCLKGATVRLIKDAQMVIYHFSESINYVTYFQKPIVPITLDCIENDFGYAIRVKARSIGAPVFNISDFYKSKVVPNSIPFYDDKMYQRYLDLYMPTSYDYDGLEKAISDYVKERI